MNALSHIKQLPETQTEIRNFAEMAVSELQIRDALPLLARLTAMEKLAKMMKDLKKAVNLLNYEAMRIIRTEAMTAMNAAADDVYLRARLFGPKTFVRYNRFR